MIYFKMMKNQIPTFFSFSLSFKRFTYKIIPNLKILTTLGFNLFLCYPCFSFQPQILITCLNISAMRPIEAHSYMGIVFITFFITRETFYLLYFVNSSFFLVLKLVSQNQSHFFDFCFNKYKGFFNFTFICHFIDLCFYILHIIFY